VPVNPHNERQTPARSTVQQARRHGAAEATLAQLTQDILGTGVERIHGTCDIDLGE
jgi:hypothetical protein